jgi:GxxExxY protein
MLYEQELTDKIIGAALEVHRTLGPGLLESTYAACLAHELALRELPFEKEKPLPVRYKDVLLDCGYRLDFLVDGKVIIELKSVDQLAPIHTAQLMTYLRLMGCQVGLLMNFNVEKLRDGIVRRVI